jgi:uncharacterized repeat protein (TIGR02543 family)
MPFLNKAMLSDTLIQMSDGSFKRADELEIGDILLSYDMLGMPDETNDSWKTWTIDDPSTNGEITTSTITNIKKITVEEDIYVINGKIELTASHPIFAYQDQIGAWKWKSPHLLYQGNLLFKKDGSYEEITMIEIKREIFELVSIDVENIDNFFAEEDGYLLHNNQFEIINGGSGTVSYTITWNPNGGTWTDNSSTSSRTTTVNSGGTPTQPASLTRTGFTFSNWSPTITSATQDRTYTAQWTENSAPSSSEFVVNLSSISPTTVLSQSGVSLTLNFIILGDTIGSPNGYNVNIYTAETGGTFVKTVASSSTNISTGVTITTDFLGVSAGNYFVELEYRGEVATPRRPITVQTVTYTITWNPNGGTWSTSPTTGNRTTTVNSGVTPTQPAALSRTGFTFSNWSPTITSATQNATYTAQWTADIYEQSFSNGGGSGVMTNQSFEAGTPFTLSLNTFTRTGYTFDGWTVASANGTLVYTNEETVVFFGTPPTLIARWLANSFLITLNPNTGTTALNSAISVTYEASIEAFNLNMIPTKSDHIFLGYYTASSGGDQIISPLSYVNLTSTTYTSSTTLYAQWQSLSDVGNIYVNCGVNCELITNPYDLLYTTSYNKGIRVTESGIDRISGGQTDNVLVRTDNRAPTTVYSQSELVETTSPIFINDGSVNRAVKFIHPNTIIRPVLQRIVISGESATTGVSVGKASNTDPKPQKAQIIAQAAGGGGGGAGTYGFGLPDHRGAAGGGSGAYFSGIAQNLSLLRFSVGSRGSAGLKIDTAPFGQGGNGGNIKIYPTTTDSNEFSIIIGGGNGGGQQFSTSINNTGGDGGSIQVGSNSSVLQIFENTLFSRNGYKGGNTNSQGTSSTSFVVPSTNFFGVYLRSGTSGASFTTISTADDISSSLETYTGSNYVSQAPAGDSNDGRGGTGASSHFGQGQVGPNTSINSGIYAAFPGAGGGGATSRNSASNRKDGQIGGFGFLAIYF